MNKKLLITLCCFGGLLLIPFIHKSVKENPQSLAENPEYLELCKQALIDERVFKNFKRDPLYALFKEYTTFDEGKQFLEVIYRDSPDLLNPLLMKKFHSNDLIGNPQTFLYSRIGLFSPSTLRYIKVVSDLRRHFGNLDGKRIVEIGGSYGGQCKILSDLFAFASYTFIDMPESLDLTKKYLTQFDFIVKSEEIENIQECDLVVSHFGFSELNANLQKYYIKRIFSKAKGGFLVCNFFPKTYGLQALSERDLLKTLTKAGISYEILPEEPLTGKNHFIIMWKR